jgi:hypothetical protein
MGVVELNGDLERQVSKAVVVALPGGKDVLESSAHKEVFLFQSQDAAQVHVVVGYSTLEMFSLMFFFSTAFT